MLLIIDIQYINCYFNNAGENMIKQNRIWVCPIFTPTRRTGKEDEKRCASAGGVRFGDCIWVWYGLVVVSLRVYVCLRSFSRYII